MATPVPPPMPEAADPKAVKTPAKNPAKIPGENGPDVPNLDGQAVEGQAPGEEPFRPAPDFWRQPWVQNVLPLATSLAFHLGLIIIAYLGYQTVKTMVAVVKEQIIIPESTLAETNPGGIPHPGLGADPTRDAAQDIEKNVPPDSQGWAAKASDNLNQAVASAAGDTDSSMISVGTNSAIGGKGGNGLSGSGDGSGALARFGQPGGGGGIGPKSSFAGTGGNARKIMYLCDASGSMLGVFGQLKVELKKSIEQLKPSQMFNVVFFSDDNVFPLSKGGLIMATPDNKHKAYDFIDNAVSTGGTQPIPAINFAMSEHPELTYVLTDGFDQIANFEEVTNAFAKGNADKKMKINCIFLQSDEDPKLVEVLSKIAKENGGMMKKILKSDF